jgi:hypothetical protein
LYYNDLPLDQCIRWFEEGLQKSMASKPTPFDTFCQKKLEEFRECVAIQMSRSGPLKAKLQKLIDMIINLHTPGSRGNPIKNNSLWYCKTLYLVGLVLVRTKFHTVALEEFLNKCPNLIKHKIVVGHLTGQGSTEELSLSGTQQATVLKEFRKGKLYFIQNHILYSLWLFRHNKFTRCYW